MAGLGNPTPSGAPAPTAQQAPASSAAEPLEDGYEEPTPEEQQLYDKFEAQLLAVIYPQGDPGKVLPEVLANLEGKFAPEVLAMFEMAEPALTDSPQDSVAATTVLMTMMVEHTAGVEFPDEIVLHGAKAMLEELVEISEAANIHDFSEEEMEGIFYRAADLYRISSPRADPLVLKEQFSELMAANEEGNLGAILPGLPGGAPLQQGAA